MDVVIPVGLGSRCLNLELRYCLRGIAQFLPYHSQIFIYGECPRWVQNAIHIPVREPEGYRYKSRNIYQKVLLACQDARVSEQFYFFNDDHFLLQDFAGTYDFKGWLSDSAREVSIYNTYRQTLANTIKLIGDAKDFDTHCPIIYDKALFVRSVGSIKWNVAYGYCIKSIYCHMNAIRGEAYPDLKIKKHLSKEEIRRRINGRRYFSTTENLSNATKSLFEELYPKKSIYESD